MHALKSIAVVAIFITTIAVVLFIALEREDRRVCLELQNQALENKNNKLFYVTPLQKEYCSQAGFEIDAPVKTVGDVDKMYE